MSSEMIDHSRKIAIAAYKKNSVEKVGYVEYIETRGVALCSNIRKAKAFTEPETVKMLQLCRKTCPEFDFLEFRMD
ncbi:MAG TPA: hypothetical protein VFG19_01835 [Geobacteraceae bacterium]|nr:hypothetical protein [Geobacteraceae bacterium]